MIGSVAAAVSKLIELRRYENLTRVELEQVKLAKFRRLVAHACAHSPYYADIVKARRIDVAACTPADFPVLTKSVLMDNFDRILTDRRVTKQTISEFLTRSHDPAERLFGRYHVIHTSGTSGQVGYFVYAPRELVRGLLVRRTARGGRVRLPGSRRARLAFYGATDGHYAGVTMATAVRQGLMKPFIKLAVFEINRPLTETVAALNAYQPDVLTSYTDALKRLAREQRGGALRISPIALGATGETMTRADAAVIASAFGVEPKSHYGSSEHLLMGASNPDGATMTLYDDELIYEPADDYCLVTNLFNFTEPLIRYRMSDVLRPVANLEPTSRHLVIDTLVGRTELTPTFVNREGVSEFVSPIAINEIFAPGVTRFQMRLTGPSAFRFLVTLEADLNAERRTAAVAELKRRLVQILATKKLSNVAFDVAVVDEIPPNPKSRKFKLVVDER